MTKALRKGQLKTLDQATVTPTQHKKPCVDCPFGRIAVPGWLAGSTPEEWVMMAHGESRIECHTMISEGFEPGTSHQCAGAAIYRTNVCKDPRDRTLLTLPKNTKLVFSGPKEFTEHHTSDLFKKKA